MLQSGRRLQGGRSGLLRARSGLPSLPRTGRPLRHVGHANARRAWPADPVVNQLEADRPPDLHVIELGAFEIAAVKEDGPAIAGVDEAAEAAMRQLRDPARRRTAPALYDGGVPRWHHLNDRFLSRSENDRQVVHRRAGKRESLSHRVETLVRAGLEGRRAPGKRI
jgi:hypothetical protein